MELNKSKLATYKTIVFDCDGVCLNSNKIKSDAFYEIAKSYNENVADIFRKYHENNGGISREIKFYHLINKLLEDPSISVKDCCDKFNQIIFDKLLNCGFSSDLLELKKIFSVPWMIISGGNQKELELIFKKRKLSYLFELGIFGSPLDKNSLFKLNENLINFPAIYFGDSKMDYIFSKKNNLDFCFVSKWTDFKNWKKYFYNKKVYIIQDFKDILV